MTYFRLPDWFVIRQSTSLISPADYGGKQGFSHDLQYGDRAIARVNQALLTQNVTFWYCNFEYKWIRQLYIYIYIWIRFLNIKINLPPLSVTFGIKKVKIPPISFIGVIYCLGGGSGRILFVPRCNISLIPPPLPPIRLLIFFFPPPLHWQSSFFSPHLPLYWSLFALTRNHVSLTSVLVFPRHVWM